MGSDNEPDMTWLLLRRFRCVAFAALGEGITEAELREALRVAVLADAQRRGPATPARLRLVPG